METSENVKIPIWFWVVMILMLLWNLMGVGSFLYHALISDEALQAMPEAERDLYAKYPAWTYVAFALAVLGGTLGSIGLLLRASWSRMVLLVSLVAIVVQMYHSLFIAKSTEVYGPGAVVMPIMVVLVAVFLVWLAGYAQKRGWV
ncbi:hypothetical protein [Reichenbachiella agariperforans]|uniref:Sugar transporter n=1 Tax=Reichenbachiella agariperforans TaxID=156994 RepID=A0A1M6SY35_REIAG|nr:hypothetical protein [Reichenbachiella agariperforans]MBU2916320.1 hypothetical protein [Reichenbachiella agariperforans]SHK49557.1 hypothetical protein SAMN04488028_105200 [Reichenbachiella agariperforans]